MPQKILIIDDDNDFILLVTEILTRKNHLVFSADTIAVGMTILNEKKPDVVFLDNQLPDGSGWSKTEYILEKYPDIKLNLMSGLDVPKTSTTSFRILEKQQMLDELMSNY